MRVHQVFGTDNDPIARYADIPESFRDRMYRRGGHRGQECLDAAHEVQVVIDEFYRLLGGETVEEFKRSNACLDPVGRRDSSRNVGGHRHLPGPGLDGRYVFHQFDITGLPLLVKPGLERPVEAQDDAPALAGHSLNPVAFLAGGGARPEVDIRRAVGILLNPTLAVQARELLVRLQHGSCLVVIEHQ